jgi:hypothetical protein
MGSAGHLHRLLSLRSAAYGAFVLESDLHKVEVVNHNG